MRARLSETFSKRFHIDFRQSLRAQEGITFLLGVLCAVGPISTDIYLPAFPLIEQNFHAKAGSAGLTLSTWMIGLALGQMVMGPLSDRFGRRLVMFWGMIFYIVSSIACAHAPSLSALAVARFFAALAAASCIVIPSAAIRDFAQGDVASRLMSRLILVQGAVPALAPMLGGVALEWVSWRAIFWSCAAYGVISAFFVFIIFPETLSQDHRRPINLVSIIQRSALILRDPHFKKYSVIYGLSGFIFFAYLSAAPNIFQKLYHFSPTHYGMIFGLCAVFMIGASQLNALMIGRIGNERMTSYAIACLIMSTLALLLVSMIALRYPNSAGHLRPLTLPFFVAFLSLTLATGGIIAPNAIVNALRHHHTHAGSASALIGTMQYLFGAVASFIIGVLSHDSPMPMVVLILIAGFVMGLIATKKKAVWSRLISRAPRPSHDAL